jgi:hypothetical protein
MHGVIGSLEQLAYVQIGRYRVSVDVQLTLHAMS